MRQHERQVEVGLLQPDPQRVAIDRLETGDFLVVVELRALFRRLRELVQADDLVLHQPRPRRAELRIDEPLQRVHEILRDELALLAVERRVGREVDALPDLERVRLAVVGDLGQRLSGERHELGRTRQVVVAEQRLEDHLLDLR